MRPYPLSLTS